MTLVVNPENAGAGDLSSHAREYLGVGTKKRARTEEELARLKADHDALIERLLQVAKDLKQRFGWSQGVWSEMSGLTRQHVSTAIGRMKRNPLSSVELDSLHSLADTAKVSRSWLTSGEGTKELGANTVVLDRRALRDLMTDEFSAGEPNEVSGDIRDRDTAVKKRPKPIK